MCAYTIELELFKETAVNTDLGTQVTFKPPRYLPIDQDYVDVRVAAGVLERFYYPFNLDQSGDLLIFANKTASIGQSGLCSL